MLIKKLSVPLSHKKRSLLSSARLLMHTVPLTIKKIFAPFGAEKKIWFDYIQSSRYFENEKEIVMNILQGDILPSSSLADSLIGIHFLSDPSLSPTPSIPYSHSLQLSPTNNLSPRYIVLLINLVALGPKEFQE